jgi:hypothetical protein
MLGFGRPQHWPGLFGGEVRTTPTFIAAAHTPNNNTMTPTSAVGDLQLVFDTRTTSTIPQVLTGFTSIATMATPATFATAGRVMYRFTTSINQVVPANGDASTNSRMVCVYRNVDPVAPIFAVMSQFGTVSPILVPALGALPGNTIVGAGFRARDIDSESLTFTSVITHRAGQGAAGPFKIGDSNGALASFAGLSLPLVTTAPDSQKWIAWAAALRGALA